MKILCSAQSFGYGPCSKLVTFIKYLRKISKENLQIDFLGDDAALTFALQNPLCFNNILEYRGFYPNPKKYEVVISVMNPYLAIWGWLNRKRVLYIDSLYWFWKWRRGEFKHLEKIIQELRSVDSTSKAWAILKGVDDHHLQYIAHRLSSISCIQKFSQESFSEVNNVFRKKELFNFYEVGSIIDTSFKKTSKRKHPKRNKVLISMGGLLSPSNTIKEGIRYVNFVLKLLDDFLRLLPPDVEAILTTNPEVVKHVQSKAKNLRIVSLNKDRLLSMLNETIMMLAPASITTIYESLTYDVPLIFLPEQHDGHFSNFLRLSSEKVSLSELRTIFPETLFNTRVKRVAHKNPEKEILLVQGLIKKSLSSFSDPVVQNMKDTLKKCLVFINDDKKCKELLLRQQQLVLKEIQVLDKKETRVIVDKLFRTDKLPLARKKYKIGIISSAIVPEDKSLIRKAEWLGKAFASNEINITTGASIGYAHLIGLAGKQSGTKLTGYSPAMNSFLHQKESDSAPEEDFNEIHFSDSGFTARSLDFLTSVDAIIMLAGRIGTLSEFTIAFEETIPVFILKGFGGISDHIEQILKLAKKENRAHISIFLNEKDLMKSLIEFLNRHYYKENES